MRLLGVVGLLAVLLWTGCIQAAIDLAGLPTHVGAGQDELRLAASQARCERDWERALSLCADILQQAPGDGWALREIVKVALHRNDIVELHTALAAGDRSAIPQRADLGDADLEFLLGVCCYHLSSLATARTHFERALELRPDMPWAHFLLFETEVAMLLPRSIWEPHLTTFLSDPRTVAYGLLRMASDTPRELFGELADEAKALLRPSVGGSELGAAIQRQVVIDRLLAGDLTRAVCDSLWRDYEERHGVLVRDTVDHFGFYIANSLPTREALEFYAAHDEIGGEPMTWLFQRASIQRDLGHVERADSLLASVEKPNLVELSLRLRLAIDLGSDEVLQQAVRAARDFSLSRYLYSEMTDALQALGRTDELAAYRQQVAVENPKPVMSDRLFGLKYRDIDAVQAVLDSLRAAGADVALFDRTADFVAESRGDTLAIAELLAGPCRFCGLNAILNRADAAFVAGRFDRGKRLFRVIMDHYRDNPRRLAHVVSSARWIKRHQLADDALRQLQTIAPVSPVAIDLLIEGLIETKEYESARVELQQAVALPGLPPSLAAKLAAEADLIGEQSIADELMQAALAGTPDNPEVRFTHAWLLVRQRQLTEAAAILEPLTAAFPGRERYRSLLMSASGEVQTLAEAQTEVAADEFGPFAHELIATDWIRQRMVPPDSASNETAVYLLQQTSYNIENVLQYSRRVRTVLHLLDKGGVEQYQTIRIPFLPQNGVPAVRVARVIAADGTVTDVDPADILVAAMEDDAVDVSDARHLVVPFAKLAEGCVVDLVYDEQNRSLLQEGWSFRHIFGDAETVREELLEVRVRDDLNIDFFREYEPVAAVEQTLGSARLYRWTMVDHEPLPYEEFTPDPFLCFPWVGCSSHESWSDAGERYGDDYWRQVAATPEIETLARRLTADADGKEEKLEAIFHFVANDVRSLAIELDRGRIIPTPAREVLEREYGDCKDKVTLMIALLAAVDIEALPALVSVWPGRSVLPDFVELNVFSHLIAFLPDVHGGLFCDPTLGRQRAVDLPVPVADRWCLVVGRDDDAFLRKTPAGSADLHGFTMTVDIRPLPDNQADIEIVASYSGQLANLVEQMVSHSDTTVSSYAVDRIVGYGTWDSCQRIAWNLTPDDEGGIQLTATYRDTLWSDGEIRSIPLRYVTEVADPFLSYPEAEDRKFDVRLGFPFANRVTLRLHDGQGWRIDDRIAPYRVAGSFYRGRIECAFREAENDRFLEVEQEFTLENNQIPLADYQEFHADWYRFQVGLHQAYHYRLTTDMERVEQLEEYVREHPDDPGFALQAVDQILGSDLGGDGEPGRQRREVARRILGPLLQLEDVGSMPLILMASLEMQESRYRAADSLASLAVARDPNDFYAQIVLCYLKRELRDLDSEIAIMHKLVAGTGSVETQLELASALYAAGRDDEALGIEERLFMLNTDTDSLQVLMSRLDGYARAERHDDMEALLPRLRGKLPEEVVQLYEVDVLMGRRLFAEAAAQLEERWADNPFDSMLCNNLAWCYAMAGLNLDRAEELVNAAIILSDDDSADQNTLGAVYARRGEWKEARKLFVEILESDDRPDNVQVNSYFIGLCDYQLGEEEAALGLWQQTLDLPGEPKWRRIIELSLALAAAGDPVTRAVFSDAEPTDDE
ncbi:MAG: tetratricopeptide repeat protein [bacterium]